MMHQDLPKGIPASAYFQAMQRKRMEAHCNEIMDKMYRDVRSFVIENLAKREGHIQTLEQKPERTHSEQELLTALLNGREAMEALQRTEHRSNAELYALKDAQDAMVRLVELLGEF